MEQALDFSTKALIKQTAVRLREEKLVVHSLYDDADTKFFRDGIELEKGAVLSEARIEANKDLYEYYATLWTAYPDLFVDLITPVDSNITLYFYQRIFLRACMRYRYHYCVAPRAFSKTFVSILAMILKCIFQPGIKVFLCAPKKEQGAKIVKEKVEEILNWFPLLRKELIKNDYVSGSDYIRLAFRNGSIFDVVAALDSQRGGRRNAGIIDETRDHDPDTLNEVVLPLLNVNRRTKNGSVNPYENHQNQIYITSAGVKSSFAYQKLIELLETEIISPRNAFVWGCDYRIPMMHNLLSKQYINEIKMSATYKDDSFAREYLGLWTAGSSDSWFDFDRLSSYRKILNPETEETLRGKDNVFYILSVDVGRLNCQTVVSVFKVFRGDEDFSCALVNIYILGLKEQTKHFSIQALDLKRLISKYNPKEVIIDANGLGVGLMDYMVQESVDGRTGEYYPAYCSFNNEDYRQSLYPNAIPLIFAIKANDALDAKVHSNCYTKVYAGKVRFLAKEQSIKNKLMSTATGQQMDPEKKMLRMRPHQLTTRLIEEMSNFRLKTSGTTTSNAIKLEKINTSMLSDKFSSFEYGLWRIKEIEEDYYKKQRKKRGGKSRKLAFYTSGGD